MKKQTKDIFMYTLAAFVMLLLFGSLVVILVKVVPQENKDLAYMALGLSLGWGTTIVQYFFGSSKNSAEKTDVMAESMRK